jgi:3-isopropylmalate/(R)-2-methylmalate dehydratase small subunit
MFNAPNLTARVAHVFPQPDFDVDLIIGVENIRVHDPGTLAQCAKDRLGARFATTVAPGDVVVGCRNFGYGHPHVQAMMALRHLGIVAVIADSFTPGFWRGEIFNGFPLIASPGISDAAAADDIVTVEWNASRLIVQGKTSLPFLPHSPFERRLLESKGIVGLLEAKKKE